MNSTFLKITTGILLLTLAACSTTPKTLQVSTNPVQKPTLTLPQADTLNLREIDWLIVNEDNFQETIDKLKASGKDPVLFALTDDGYTKLALNLADVRTYIEQQRTIIASYGRYYIDADKQLADAQRQIGNINKQLAVENAKRSAASNSKGSLFGVIN